MSNTSCHLGRCRTRSGRWQAARRSASSSQHSGRNNRQSSGQLACSVTALTDTPSWQLAVLPSVPEMLLWFVKHGCGQVPVELSGDVALEAADDFLLGLAFLGAACDVVLGPLVAVHPAHGGHPQAIVGLPVTAAVKPMADGLPRGRLDPRCPTQVREGGFGLLAESCGWRLRQAVGSVLQLRRWRTV